MPMQGHDSRREASEYNNLLNQFMETVPGGTFQYSVLTVLDEMKAEGAPARDMIRSLESALDAWRQYGPSLNPTYFNFRSLAEGYRRGGRDGRRERGGRGGRDGRGARDGRSRDYEDEFDYLSDDPRDRRDGGRSGASSGHYDDGRDGGRDPYGGARSGGRHHRY